MTNRVYIRWGRRRNRADDLSKALGAELIVLGWHTKNPLLVPVRYIIQFFATIVILFQRNPGIIFAQHTHPFCSLACLIYAKLTHRKCITDCHNGPFTYPIWNSWPFNYLNRHIYLGATVNLVHNEEVYRYVKMNLHLPGVFMVLHDPIPDLHHLVPKPGIKQPSVLVISSFDPDEPLASILQATSLTPEVQYFITGDKKRLKENMLENIGGNITFTDYIPNQEYDSLLRSVTAAMALSSRENVLTRASHEAMGAETPFITSDIPVSRYYLSSGTVFVTNDPDSIAKGIREAIGDIQRLRIEMRQLRLKRLREWKQELDDLLDLLENENEKNPD